MITNTFGIIMNDYCGQAPFLCSRNSNNDENYTIITIDFTALFH